MNEQERKMYDFMWVLIETVGKKLKVKRNSEVVKAFEKSSHSDLVTEHDVYVDNLLTSEIKDKFPYHCILSEEGGNCRSQNNEGYRWIIDPIDGTTNYFRNGKDYAISIALYNIDKPVFGLVYDCSNNIMYSGIHGQKIENDNACEVKELKNAVISMSSKTIKSMFEKGVNVIDLLSKAQAHRYLGCASIEICKVANKEYDMYISTNVYEWDIAAARIYLEQRGGHMVTKKATYSKDFNDKFFVAAFKSKKLWEETKTLIKFDE
ncbi:inositol monophosphatase family protein [Herbivorax sp. ANBcel31]|uniref:inositol monophosphatase family protein n=1 Tax=Herbivorax sp. ANBcel31 TaxID=3069754 RepID=UPI0027B528E6|nr:inositol monophosphatase family protein [Herbivorax sp. ANBcel31]MDQ2086745.1 inositol monophosphatase family protein [Herbivorax sp. ANBcel31]